MTDLWMYFRRPSCRIRYRHGGTNAIYPMVMHQPEPRHRVSVQSGGSIEAAAPPSDFPAPDSPSSDSLSADNILPFVQPEKRTGRRTPRKRGQRGGAFDHPKGSRRD